MRIGQDEVIILYGGDLDDKKRQVIVDALYEVGIETVVCVLANVDQGLVNGDDGRGYTANIIATRTVEAEPLAVRGADD